MKRIDRKSNLPEYVTFRGDSIRHEVLRIQVPRSALHIRCHVRRQPLVGFEQSEVRQLCLPTTPTHPSISCPLSLPNRRGMWQPYHFGEMKFEVQYMLNGDSHSGWRRAVC